MFFVKISRGGREVNMIDTVTKILLSKIGWKGGVSISIWIMSLNILFFWYSPLVDEESNSYWSWSLTIWELEIEMEDAFLAEIYWNETCRNFEQISSNIWIKNKLGLSCAKLSSAYAGCVERHGKKTNQNRYAVGNQWKNKKRLNQNRSRVGLSKIPPKGYDEN